jgi:hypothetical protein
MKYNPTVITNRTVLMQHLTDALSHGYVCYVSGSVSPQRASALVTKFDIVYQVSADRNSRARRKRSGLGNARLVLFYRDGVIYWWLLVTSPESGEHAAHALENLKDAVGSATGIQIDGFELIRMPKPADKLDVRKSSKSQNRLTWRMRAAKERDWRCSIIDAVRSGTPYQLDQLIYRLWSSPGFGGIRSQIGKMAALYRNEIKRAGRKDAPALPKRLGYVRRLKFTGIPLAKLVSQLNG